MRCQQRQLQAACQLDRCLIAGLLRAVVVALQLDVHIFAAIDRDEFFDSAAACLPTTLSQRISQQTFLAAGKTDKSRGIFSEIGHRGDCWRI